MAWKTWSQVSAFWTSPQIHSFSSGETAPLASAHLEPLVPTVAAKVMGGGYEKGLQLRLMLPPKAALKTDRKEILRLFSSTPQLQAQ